MPRAHPLTTQHHRDPAAAKQELSRLLREHGGNRSALARTLGVHRDVVFTWIREWGLEVEPGRDGRPRTKGLTTCGYCSYEEADGSLIEQCATCENLDAGRRRS